MLHTSPNVSFEDHRGLIKDLLVGESVDAITLIETNKGGVRGNHYHKKTIQWIYMLSGSLEYVFQTGDSDTERVVLGPGHLVKTEAWEKHAFIALEASQFLVFSRGPRSGESYEDDTFRLDEPLIGRDG